MKSIICVLLALVMLLSLTACGEQSDTAKPDHAVATTAQTEMSTDGTEQTGAVTTTPTSVSTTSVTEPATTTEPTTTTTDPNNSIVITGQFCVSDSEGTRWVEDADVVSAEAQWQQNESTGSKSPILVITLTDEGAQKYKAATEANLNKILYLWVGDVLLATPVVNDVVENGEIVVTFNGWDDESFRDIQKIAEAIMA